MKHRYSIDNDNRLLIKSPKTKKPQKVYGRFALDKDNRLICWLNEPESFRRHYGLPSKIIFKGNWQLNQNHDLELVLDETKGQYKGDILCIKGNIIATDGVSLAFEVKTYDQNGLLHTQILKFCVTWLTDETNRLTFIVKKYSPDIITLEGDWQLNKNQQITYTYEKVALKTKTRTSQVLTFMGFWRIDSANRLTYILTSGAGSRFDFRAQLESPNLYPQEGRIKYRIGMGLKKQKFKIICLYGTWKFGKKFGILFTIDYGRAKFGPLEFGANVNLNHKDELVFALTNKQREPLGMRVTFTHRFLKKLDASGFLRIKKLQDESNVEAGFQIPF